MKISIEVNDLSILDDIFSDGKNTVIIPGTDVEFTFKEIENNNLIEAATVISFVAGHIDALFVGLFTSWLYDKLKDKAKKLVVDDEEIEISKDKIESKFK